MRMLAVQVVFCSLLLLNVAQASRNFYVRQEPVEPAQSRLEVGVEDSFCALSSSLRRPDSDMSFTFQEDLSADCVRDAANPDGSLVFPVDASISPEEEAEPALIRFAFTFSFDVAADAADVAAEAIDGRDALQTLLADYALRFATFETDNWESNNYVWEYRLASAIWEAEDWQGGSWLALADALGFTGEDFSWSDMTYDTTAPEICLDVRAGVADDDLEPLEPELEPESLLSDSLSLLEADEDECIVVEITAHLDIALRLHLRALNVTSFVSPQLRPVALEPQEDTMPDGALYPFPTD